MRSWLTAPYPSLSPAAGIDAKLALLVQPPPEMVDGTPTRAFDDMDLDVPLWEHDANGDE